MDQLEQITRIIALNIGLARASGINLCAIVLTLRPISDTGSVELAPDLRIVAVLRAALAAGAVAELGSGARPAAAIVGGGTTGSY